MLVGTANNVEGIIVLVGTAERVAGSTLDVEMPEMPKMLTPATFELVGSISKAGGLEFEELDNRAVNVVGHG